MCSKYTKIFLSTILILLVGYTAKSQTALNGEQRFYISFSSPTHQVHNGYLINSCPEDTIEIIVTGIYYFNNSSYHQSDSSTTFSVTSSLNFIANHNIIKIIPTGTTYDSLMITAYDIQGDTSYNSHKIIIISEESTTTFSGTFTPYDTICQNSHLDILGNATNNISVTSGRINMGHTTYLPDGSGVSYNSTINVYTSLLDTILSPNDFSIFANLEHSYIGDLKIELISPSGVSVILKSYPGGGTTYCGEPIDQNSQQIPGIGYEYHWQNNGTIKMRNTYDTYSYSFTNLLGLPDTNRKYLPPSYSYPSNSTMTTTQNLVVYLPDDPLSLLVGTPLNGAWTLKVTDFLSIDNGFIFDWGIILNSVDSTHVFDRINSKGWVNSPGVIYNTGDTISVFPETSGDHSFTYSATDIFGCIADTIVNIYARPIPELELGNDTTICENQSITLDVGNNNTLPIWSNGSTNQTIIVDSTNIGIKDTTISVKIEDQYNCINFDTITITFVDCTSINDNYELVNLNIFPNPSNGLFTIKGDINNQEIISVEIIDINGKKVFKENNINNGNFINQSFDISNYSSGTYFIKIITNKDTFFLKKILVN